MRDLYRKLGVARDASSEMISSALNARRFTLTQVEINDIESVLLNSKRRKIYDSAHKTMQTIVDIRARISPKSGSLFDSELAHDFIPTPNPKKQTGESKSRKAEERNKKPESTKSNRSQGASTTDESKQKGQDYQSEPKKKKTAKQSTGPADGYKAPLYPNTLTVLIKGLSIVIGFSLLFIVLLSLIATYTARNGERPTRRENPYVTWTDNTGKFSVVAKYVDVRDKNVVLLKPDGKELEVPIARLSVSSFNLAKDYYERAKAKAKSSQVGISKLFSGRNGAKKTALLTRFGGTRQTQEAVKRGLEWLQKHQTEDGSWSMRGPYNDGGFTENKTAATAMALLAFLGDGHTHQGGNYQQAVAAGLNWLVNEQDQQGFFAKNARSHEKMYAQAQATIALCELYSMTRDASLRQHAQRAIDFAEKAQSESGGWRYEPNYDSDTSVTGWYVMALESGRAAQLDVNVAVLNRVMLYLDDAASNNGSAYGYEATSASSSTMTAVGLLCRQYIGWKRDETAMVRGTSALVEDALFDIADQDVYYWYYASQVLRNFGGSPWRRWNDVMKIELPTAQVKTGRESGSWAPQGDRWGRNSGRLYTTCLSLLCLEVYYRHLPLYAASWE